MSGSNGPVNGKKYIRKLKIRACMNEYKAFKGTLYDDYHERGRKMVKWQ